MSDEARGDQCMGSSFHRQGAAYLKERLVIFKEERVRWASKSDHR